MSSLTKFYGDYKFEIWTSAIALVLTFIYFTGVVVYKDHQGLVSRIGVLKGEIKAKDETIKQLGNKGNLTPQPQNNLTRISNYKNMILMHIHLPVNYQIYNK